MLPNQSDFLTTRHHQKLLAICTLMALITFFDFMVFWYSTNVISSLFFSQELDSSQHSFYMILIFASGYLVRPIGATLLGLYGDRYGRKPAITLSFVGVTVFTLIIALLPTYDMIGPLATWLFVLARLGQGMSFSGQLPALWVYTSEQLPASSVGVSCGIVCAGSIFSGVLLVGLLGFLDSTLTQSELFAYGWRIPFLIGGLLGGICFFLLNSLNETPVFLNNQQKITNPTLKQRWQGFIPLLILSWFMSSVVMILVFFLIDLISLTFFIDENLLTIAFVLSLLFLVVGCVFFGFLTDRLNGGKVIITGCILFLLAVVGLFYDLEEGGNLMLFSLSWVGFCAGVIGAIPNIMVRLCPVQYRLSTLSIGYNLSYAVSGAFVPILLGFLTYHADFAPAVYLSFVCIITMFLGFYIYYSPRHKDDIEN